MNKQKILDWRFIFEKTDT